METRLNSAINEFLFGMRLKGLKYNRLQLDPPFGVSFGEQGSKPQFHFVAQGQAYLRGPDQVFYRLEAGDAVLIPQGGKHALLSHAQEQCKPLTQLKAYPICDVVHDVVECGLYSAVADRTIVFSAEMEFELGSMGALIKVMPAVMHAGTLSKKSPEILPIVEAMEREACTARAGFANILARLAEVVAISIVRVWVEEGCGDANGWLQAMRDPKLGRVIVALHREPGQDWTLEKMAAVMGSSRSVFAERFLAVTGMTPAKYMTELRMNLAAEWMARDRLAIELVADKLGYSSQAAFSRAFKRVMGQAPSVYRGEAEVQ